MKYALIGYNNPTHKRGAFTEANRLALEYPDNAKAFDSNTINDINILRSNFDRIVYTYQNPNKLREKHLLNINFYDIDIIYIRKNIFTIYKYKTTNGFSMYLENPFYVNYVPMILPMIYDKNNDDKIVIGYYIRPQYRPDDFNMFINFLKNIKYDIELYIMGSFIYDFKYVNDNIKKVVYTTDNNLFFSKITHYVYSESNVFDPWPTTLQEAVNNNKQIILLEQNRTFNDGITDIKRCIKYHTQLDSISYNNSECILNKWNWNNYYPMVFENNFEYIFDRNKYKKFSDWLEQW